MKATIANALTATTMLALAASGVLGQTCEPQWADGLFEGTKGLDGDVQSLAVFDDGTGSRLFASGNFSLVGGEPAARIATWDGTTWSPVGMGLGGPAFSMVEFDDGRGPALYVTGFFRTASGTTVNRIARWDGATWSALGDGFDFRGFALAVFDDGSGPALYAAGEFTTAGGEPANRIAKWDGTSWFPLGEGLNDNGFGLAVFDDGSGDALYVAGTFSTAGGVEANGIARWDGDSWSPLGTGLQGCGPFAQGCGFSLLVFDNGAGPALYATGLFTTAGGEPASRIARWDGDAWSALGTGLDGLTLLSVYDDGSGPALYAAGNFFTMAGGAPVNGIARWDGDSWTALGTGLEGGFGPGPMAVFDDGSGPGLFVGGDFTLAGGQPTSNIARWGCPPTHACRADIDGDGELTIFDFLAFQNLFDAGDLGADFDGDGSLTIFDFLAFQNAFDAGCP